MTQRTWVWLLGLVALVVGVAPQARAADLPAAYTWLGGECEPDGSFGAVGARGTRPALAALALGDEAAPFEDGAASWAWYERSDSVDLEVRRLMALSWLGELTEGDLATLAAARNADGSWGALPGHPGGLMETSLALGLYAEAGSPDLAQIASSLTWLVTRQASSGAFTWEDNSAADPILTAEILYSLVLWSETFELSSYINKGVTYLYGLQQTGGMIGTVQPELLTALTLRATTDWPSTDNTKWKSAMNALSAAQRTDGSWGGDVYTTAHSLLALGSVRPDLALTSLSVVESPLLEGATATVKATVQNQGRADLASAVDVSLAFLSAATGQESPVGLKQITTLASGASTTLTFSWPLTDVSGSGYLKAIADPTNTLKEKDRADNTLTTAVNVLGGSDVAVYAEDVVIQPGKAAPEDTLTYSAKIVSQSALAHASLKVTLHNGNPSSGGTLLTTFTLASLDVGEVEEVVWTGKLATGTHTLYLTADSNNAVAEKDETNNQITTSVQIAPRIDLQVGTGKVKVAPTQVATGTDVTVSVTVYNAGRSPSGAFTVGAYVYDPATMSSPTERVLKASSSVTNLGAGEATTVAMTVSTSGLLGQVTLYGVADSAAVISELEEGNNESSTTLSIVKAPNLQIASGDFAPSSLVREGSTTYLSATVRNTGGNDLYNVPVRMWEGSTSGAPLGTVIIQQIKAGQSAPSPSIAWSTTGATSGAHTVIVKADPDAALAESDENDNQQSATITVEPRPELSFKSGIAVNPAQPDQGDVATISAVVQNTTSTAITTPFLVRFYDGSPTTGALIGTATINSLGGTAETTPSTSWNTEGKAGRHTLYAVIDPTAVVGEGNETNNQATASVNVTSGDASLVPPTGLASTLAGDNVKLSWTAAASPAGYRVYRDGQVVNLPDTATNIVTGAAVSASPTASGFPASNAVDGNTSTWWQGDTAVNAWTYDVDLGEEMEISAFRVTWRAAGNFNVQMAFQTFDAPYWYTHRSGGITSTSTGNFSGTFTLARNVKARLVRLSLSRASSSTNPAAITELVINPPGLITTTSFTDINVDAATHAYEVRAADGGGREGEPATLSVAIGDVEPPTAPYAVATDTKTTVYFTRSTSSTVKGYELVRDNQALVYTASITGMSAAASSSSGTQPASNAVDTSQSTYWQSTTGAGTTIDLTLPAGKRIWGMNLYWRSGLYAVDYDILGWTGTEWIVEERVRSNNFSTVGHSFAQFGLTDKVRIQVLTPFAATVALNEVTLTSATPIDSAAIQDSYRPAYAIYYRVGAMSDKHVAFSPVEPFVPPRGEEAPLPPSGLTVSGWTRSDITLSWQAITSATLAGYNVYDNETGEKLNTELLTSPTFTVLGAIDPSDTSYSFAVTGMNTYGYESTTRTKLTWTPPLPAAPTLAQLTTQANVALSWNTPSEPLRDGYYVYKDGALLTTSTTGTYTDLDVTAGSHTYQVAGFDLFGRSGTRSNTVSTTVYRTDLALTSADVSFSPNPATALDTATLTATVYNLGDKASAQTTLRFYDGDPASGGTQIASVTLPAVSGGGLKSVSTTWSLSGKQGNHTLYAVADPSNSVKEWDEANNTASIAVTVLAAPALVMTLGEFDTAQFPLVSAGLTVFNNYGQAVTGLGARYLTVKEDGAAVSGLDLKADGAEGSYRLSFTSPVLSRNGLTRAVNVSASLPPASGTTTGSYLAPDDPIHDLAATLLIAAPGTPQDDDTVTFTATVVNLGSETETSVPVRFLRGGASGAPFGTATIASLAAGASATVTATAVVVSGTLEWVAVVDPDNARAERDESNNQASTTLYVPDPPAPDLSVTAVGFTPASPETGDQVVVTATVLNSGLATGSIQVQAYLGDPANGGKVVGTAVTLPSLAKDATADVTFTWDTTGLTGSQSLLVWVDPFDRIAEGSETNNRTTKAVTVTPSRTGLTVSTRPSSLGANSPLSVDVKVTPTGAFTGTAEVYITDAAGGQVAALDPIPLSGITSATTTTRTWDTGETLAGSYQAVAVLKEGAAERARQSAAFTLTPSPSLSGELTLIQTVYEPAETVEASGKLTNTSANTELAATTATLTLTSAAGAVVGQATAGPSTLLKGGTLAVSLTAELADSPPGTYTLTLKGVSGSTTTTSTRTLTVLSTQETGRGLVGLLTTNKAQAVPGEVIEADWSLENRGNSDVDGLNARVSVLSDAGDVVFEEPFDLELAKGATTSGQSEITADFGTGTFSVLLEVELSGEWIAYARAGLSVFDLRGVIAVDPEEIEGGEDGELSWTLTNEGETDLPGLTLLIDVVEQSSGEIASSQERQLDLVAGDEISEASALSTAGLRVGVYTAVLSLATDGGDPAELARATFTVTDSHPPLTTLDFVGVAVDGGDRTWVTSQTQVVLEAADGFSPVEAIFYRLDSGAEQTYAAPFTLGGEGVHALEFSARDAAGNRELSQQATLQQDDTAPTIKITGVEDRGCAAAPLTLSVEVTDAAPVEIVQELDGEPWDGAPIEEVGRHRVEITATDLVGHEGTALITFDVVADACQCDASSGCETPAADGDGDGFTQDEGDCDDTDPSSFPGGEEVCDEADNNCDGSADEGLSCGTPTLPIDSDGDGWADASDCDPEDEDVNPGADEQCSNGIDDNCDGEEDEDDPDCQGEQTDAPTDEPTDAPTDEPTDEPTDAPTDAPEATSPSDQIPTEEPSQAQTPIQADDPNGCGCDGGGGAPAGSTLLALALLAGRLRRRR